MKLLKMMQTVLIFALFVIATYIAIYIVMNRQANWIAIAIYWVVVAYKNYIDYIIDRRK